MSSIAVRDPAIKKSRSTQRPPGQCSAQITGTEKTLRNQTFNTFWHGSELSALHWACLASFVARGHKIRVFCYRPVEVPEGVQLEDASQILDEDSIFEFESSFSGFSNIFRYKLMLEDGGWWVDTDIYCLKDDVPDCTYAWARQDQETINGAVLKFPRHDPNVQKLLQASRQIGKNVAVWGQLGPDLLTQHLANREFSGHFGSTMAFYPVHYLETHLFWLPEKAQQVTSRCEQSCFLHLWGSSFKNFGIDIRVAPPKGSFLDEIYHQTSAHLRLPPLDERSNESTMKAIKAHVDQQWFKEDCLSVLGYEVSQLDKV